MTPLEDLRKRVEEAREATLEASDGGPAWHAVVSERSATDALLSAYEKRVEELEATNIDQIDELAAQANLMREKEKRITALEAALKELVAQVRGECPGLLDEDSGGDAKLSIQIDELLRSQVGGKDA